MKPGLVVGVLATLLGLLVLPPEPSAQSGVSSWSEPVNLGPPINSPFQENRVAVSTDGLSLYFSSTRPCGEGDVVLDDWVVVRSEVCEGEIVVNGQRIYFDVWVKAKPK